MLIELPPALGIGFEISPESVHHGEVGFRTSPGDNAKVLTSENYPGALGLDLFYQLGQEIVTNSLIHGVFASEKLEHLHQLGIPHIVLVGDVSDGSFEPGRGVVMLASGERSGFDSHKIDAAVLRNRVELHVVRVVESPGVD